MQLNHDKEMLPRNYSKGKRGRNIEMSEGIYSKVGICSVKSTSYKARLVIKGFTQKEIIDYQKIFSSIVKHTSLRLLLTIIVQYNLVLEHMDVDIVFLHDNLKEEIQVEDSGIFLIKDSRIMW